MSQQPNPYQPAQGLDPQGLFQMARQQEARTRPQHPAPSVEELQPHFPELEIHGLIGRGGMGAVYRAHQGDLGRDIALKVLPKELGEDPGFAERFAREARVLARLDHPNIVPVYNFGQREEWCFLTMALVDGMNLRQMMQLGRMQPEEALDIVPQICAALGYAHSQGIVHRDIKPENILIDGKGRVRIADFGLAKLAGGGAGYVTLTGTGQVMGTPQYMAPEQVTSPTAVDHRADIYSLGVVFYEMLTGALPMGRFNPPSKMSGVGPGVDDVVMRSLAQAPEDRYQQAQDVERELAAAGRARGSGRQQVAGAGRAETRLHPKIRKGLWCWLGVLVVPVMMGLTWTVVSVGTDVVEGPPEAVRPEGGSGTEVLPIGMPILWAVLLLLNLLPLYGSVLCSQGVRGIRREPHRWHGLTPGIMFSWMPAFLALTLAVGIGMGMLGESIDRNSSLSAALAVLGVALCLGLGLWMLIRETRRIEAQLGAGA